MPANKHLGEVEFKIGKKSYIVRVGTRELGVLEGEYGVEGLSEIYRVATRTTHQNWQKLAAVAFSRHHQDLPVDDIIDLLDYKESDGSRPAVKAMIEAFMHSAPKADPNEQPAATKAP